jgi:hypothetical protein
VFDKQQAFKNRVAAMSAAIHVPSIFDLITVAIETEFLRDVTAGMVFSEVHDMAFHAARGAARDWCHENRAPLWAVTDAMIYSVAMDLVEMIWAEIERLEEAAEMTADERRMDMYAHRNDWRREMEE